MTPEPEHTPLGLRLRERTQPLAPHDDAYDYAHAYLCEILVRAWAQVAELADPEGDIPPLAPLLDIDLCPAWALPWLGQLVGVRIPAGMGEDDARNLISNVSGFSRGSAAAMRAAAAMYLTGTKTVFFNERLADEPYALGVGTLADETPNPAATEAALMALKPAGIALTYITVGIQTYGAVNIEFDHYSEVNAEYADYRALVTSPPD